jgi:hypothetical protein
MAFIRRKRVHQYEYYQAVRNYRDTEGQHRQEVLCHLGVHGSLDAAIAAEQEKVNIAREEAVSHRERTEALESELLDRYGWEFVNGAIPSEAEAARELDYWWPQWEAFSTTDPRRIYPRPDFMDYEETDIQVEKYMSCIEYHAALRLASWADNRAAAHQQKLEKFLQVQREHF